MKERSIRHYRNQLLNTPRLKYDEKQKVRLYFKSGGATIMICKGLTSLAADTLSWQTKKFCKEHGVKLEGEFIQTRL